MTVPYAFANLSGNIALAKLDSNFNTPITIGNTSVLLGNTVTTLNNLTLANVTITSGTSNVTNVTVTNVTVTNLTATLANVTTLNVASAYITSANIGTLALTNALPVSSGGTGQVTFPANSVLLGNGTGGIATVAPGNVGNVLTSIGGVWVSNVAVSGAAAGANTQVQYNNANALAGSANLTFNGTTLTANTLNLTNALGTTYGGTGLTSFTANGVVYASSSSALTTGSALTFNGTLLTNTVSDAVTALKLAGTTGKVRVRPYVDSTYGVVFDSTNAAESAYLPMSFYGTNIYTNPDTAAIWRIGGSEQMCLTSTGLGIGTSSPTQKLNVNGICLFEGALQGNMIIQKTGTNGVSLFSDAAGKLAFYDQNAGVTRLTLDSSGNLGIGTTSPSASAILDAQSTTKGVRMPNMTTTQKNAISSPAAGLMVFDTTLSKLCVYTGAAWQTITSV